MQPGVASLLHFEVWVHCILVKLQERWLDSKDGAATRGKESLTRKSSDCLKIIPGETIQSKELPRTEDASPPLLVFDADHQRDARSRSL